MYYEENYRTGNLRVFEKFLTGSYDEDFTETDHIMSILETERAYSEYLSEMATSLGYTMNLQSPYLLGMGSTATGYLIEKGNRKYALRFIWGFENLRSYVTSLTGQLIIESTNLKKYVPKLYFSVFNHESLVFTYMNKSGEPDQRQHTYGIVIQEYAGRTLESIRNELNVQQRRRVLDQLNQLKRDLIEGGIVHEDLLASNIVVDDTLNVKMIDLDEVKIVDVIDPQSLEKLDDVIRELDKRN